MSHTRSLSSDLKAKSKFNPRRNLTPEQNDTLNGFITELEKEGLTPKERRYCDEACLVRYLRARDWNLKKAYKALRDTLKWRDEFKVEQITAESLTAEAATGKVYRHGFDLQKRPIIYMTPAREVSKNYEKGVQLLVYTMERAIESMEDGIEQMVWIIDFNGYSKNNSLPFSVAMETVNILSNHYPERLGVCYLCDTPWLFSLFWKTISPFINPVTYNKIAFINSESEKQKRFSAIMDLAKVEKRHGGRSSFEFNASVFWKKELEDDAKRIKKYGVHIAKSAEALQKEKEMMNAAADPSVAISADDLA